MRVIFLGTSGSTPTKARGLPAVAIEYHKDVLLFDCGEGTQRQIMTYGVNMSKIRAIFLTHVHGDHIIGIAGLVRTLALNKRTEPLLIYIPEGYADSVRHLLEFDRALIPYKIEIRQLKGGTVYKGEGYAVRGFPVAHTVKTYALVFAEDDTLHFIRDKAEKLGIRGEMFSKLSKSGSITLNGRKVSLGSVTTRKSGTKIVYATDTKPSKATETNARGADLLIHEATYAERYVKLAKERGHATAIQCAKLAKAAKVNRLVLTHISARYKNTDELVSEARTVFRNTDAAYDGMNIDL
jgi:ribonuclease Z